jgi:flagellar basal-body rod modification protein FlgD
MKVETDSTFQNFGAQRPAQTEPTQKDEFLRLLVAQLENQNPLDPQSGAEFVAQLSQFAMVEQSTEANGRLAAMQAEQVSQSGAILVGFVGKSASVSTEAVALDGSPLTSIDLRANFDEAVASSEVVVLNEAGEVVSVIDIGPHAKGEMAIEWDGTGSDGAALKEGTYRLEIRAKDESGTDVGGKLSMQGVIDELSFETGGPMMRIGGALVTPASVLSIG